MEESQLPHGESSVPEEKPPRIWIAIKNLFVFLALLVVVAGSFWLSYQLGRRILFPVKKPRVEITIPEPPPSLKVLEELGLGTKEAPGRGAAKKVKPSEAERKPLAAARPRAVVGRYYYKVHVGWFKEKAQAQSLAEKVKEQGFEVYLKPVSHGWRVQVGAFRTIKGAKALQAQLEAKGFSAKIIHEFN
jgi:cell division septation protein DedD